MLNFERCDPVVLLVSPKILLNRDVHASHCEHRFLERQTDVDQLLKDTLALPLGLKITLTRTEEFMHQEVPRLESATEQGVDLGVVNRKDLPQFSK